MANDWIKMRGGLVNHQKVVAMARRLQGDPSFREWLTPGGYELTDGQIVSDAALRYVTTAALLRVWSCAREQGKFSGADLVLEHLAVSDLDQLSETPGIGEAMVAVGWAVDKNGVTFPNFREYNVPFTPAERQARYRAGHENPRDGALRKRNAPRATKASPEGEGEKNKRDTNVSLSDQPEKKRQPNPVWDALVDLFGLNSKVHATRLGKLTRDLKALDATPEEIRTRLARYRAQWPNAEATPEALVKHWGRFAQATHPKGAVSDEALRMADELTALVKGTK